VLFTPETVEFILLSRLECIKKWDYVSADKITTDSAW
jgi:hypothetical protein